jgi:histidinol-phosphate aminotransferase
MTDPRLTPLTAGLPATVPFTGPEALERRLGARFRARLGANESLFGPSPRAIAAMQAAAAEAWMYGDPEVHELRTALAAHHGCAVAHVAAGEGIDGLLGLIVRLTVGPGVPVVTSAGAYPTFAYHVAAFGGTLHKVPYTADHEDPERLVAKARAVGARLIYFANPDNPMGTWHGAKTVARMVDAVPDGCLLLLDEAYAEFAPPGVIPALDPAEPRVIRFRTFSKAHGLAGLRVGYVIGPAGIVAALDQVRNHFGLGRIAQAGALAALADGAHVAGVVAQVAAARDRIGQIGRAAGLMPLPSATNFVTLDTGRDGDHARRLLAALQAEGVFARMPGVAPLDRCIRISAGDDAALDVLASALPRAVAMTEG